VDMGTSPYSRTKIKLKEEGHVLKNRTFKVRDAHHEHYLLGGLAIINKVVCISEQKFNNL